MSQQPKSGSPSQGIESPLPRKHDLVELGDQFAALLDPLDKILGHMKETNKRVKRTAQLHLVNLVMLTFAVGLLMLVVTRVELAVARMEVSDKNQANLLAHVDESIALVRSVSETTKETKQQVEEAKTTAAAQPRGIHFGIRRYRCRSDAVGVGH